MRRFAILALLVAGLALGLASCGGDDDTDETSATTEAVSEDEASEESGAAEEAEGAAETSASEADTTITASLGEYYIKLDKSTAPAGNIAFKATNDGTVEHELVVIATDTPASKLPTSGDEVDEAAAGEVPGEIEGVEPGATEDVTLSLKAGSYALICNLPGHYGNGQYTEFTVK